MSSIDHRIVEMQFNNQQFERGARESIRTLDALKKSLNIEGSAKGLFSLRGIADKIGLGGMASAVDTIANRFSALGIVGMTVISDLTRSVMNFAKKAAGAVLDPIIQGGKTRALNIEQAKFQFEGLGMSVEEAMDDALYAVTGTAYGLDEAAKVASQFGASGMKTGEDMKTALRAISGVAAMTNSSYEDIGHIFTTISGNGRLMGQQLLQLSGRGVNAAATLGKSMGKSEAEIRKMVTAGQISFEDFYKAMDEAFGEHAMKANETYTGSLKNVNAALARIGADVAANRLEYMRKIFNALIPAIDSFKEALDPFIERFNKFTADGAARVEKFIESLDFAPLTPILEGLANVMNFLLSILGTAKDAFLEVFPPATAKSIMAMAQSFEKLTKGLKMSEGTIDNLKSVFRGLFSILGIGYDIITGLIKGIFGVSSEMKPLGSGVLSVAAGFGEMIVALRETLQELNIFEAIGEGVVTIIGKIGEVISALFTGDSSSLKRVESFTDAWSVFLEFLIGLKDGLSETGKSLWKNLIGVAEKLGEAFKKIRGRVRDWMEDNGLDPKWDSAFLLGFTAIMYGIRKFFKFVEKHIKKDSLVGMIRNFSRNVTTAIGSVTETLKVTQNTLRSATLLMIAVSIAALAGSLMLLSTLDHVELAVGLGAISALLTSLVVAMRSMTGVLQETANFKGLIAMSIAMGILSASLVLLSISVRSLSSIDIGSLIAGLTGVVVLLGSLVGVSKLMSGSSEGLISTSAALLILSVAIGVLSSSVRKLGEMDIVDLIKGLSGVVALLLSLSGMSKLLSTTGKGLGKLAITLIPISIGLMVMSQAISMIGNMDIDVLIKGLVGIGAALLVLAGGAFLMQQALPGAAAILIMSVALIALGAALKILSTIKIGDLAKGIGAIAVALLVLGGVAALLTPVAVGLIAIGAGLTLVGAGIALIGGGVLALATGLTMLVAIGVTGVTTLGIVAQGLLTLAAGLLPTIMALIGTAIVMFANAIRNAAPAIGEAVLAVIQSILDVIAGAQVAYIEAVKTVLMAILQAIQEVLPEIVDTFVLIFTSILEAIRELLPEFALLIEEILTTIADIIISYVSFMVTLGYDIAIAFLEGISEKIPEVIETAIDVIVNFLRAIGEQTPRVIDAGIKMIIDFINGMANAIRGNTDELLRAMDNLITAIMELAIKILTGSIPDLKTKGMEIIKKGLLKGVSGEKSTIPKAFKGIMSEGVKAISGSIKNFVGVGGDVIGGLVKGISGGVGRVVTAARSAANSAYNSAKRALGIQSPSTEFEQLGLFSGEGYVVGIEGMVRDISAIASKMGSIAIDSTKKGLSGLGGVIKDTVSKVDLDSLLDMVSDIFNPDRPEPEEIDLSSIFDWPDILDDQSPTITPVLDLSRVKDGMDGLDALLSREKSVDISTDFDTNKRENNLIDSIRDILRTDRREPVEVDGVVQVEVRNDKGEIIGIAEKAIKDLLRRESR